MAAGRDFGRAGPVLQALEAGRFSGRTVVVVAHPDDETILLGGLLRRLDDLLLVHVTDGAPEDMRDARRLGFPNRGAYARTRAAELDEALRRLEVSPERRACGLPDQGAAEALVPLTKALVGLLDGAATVITHAYEGGHPDHDACALAVQAACALLARQGPAPVRLEFPAYHLGRHGRVVGRFHDHAAAPELAIRLSGDALATKRAAVDAFASQAEVAAWFTEPEVERIRPAPDHDFTEPPPPGRALYDDWGWSLTSAVWRERAAAALPALGLPRGALPPTVLSVAYPFAPVTADPVGGAEQVLAQLDRALVEAGWRSIVVAAEGSAVAGRLVPTPAPPGPINGAVRAEVQAAVRSAVEDVLATTPVDLVHLHGIDFPAYLPPPGPPVLATLHLPLGWYAPDALQPRPDVHLLPVSADQAATAPEGSRLLPPIENGVALDGPRLTRRGYALFLGRICPEKGVHHALDAADAAGVSLLIAGEVFAYPEHQAYFEGEIRPRLDRRRRWIGPVGGRRKRRLLAAARCVLIPSTAPETSSLVAREAAAAGTPVIAFRSGALPRTVEHGRTGLIVDDAAGMAQALGRVDGIDPDACRAAARARFDVRRATDEHLALYRRLIGKSPA